MDYVDWVGNILVATGAAWKAANEDMKDRLGISYRDVATSALATSDTEITQEFELAVYDALVDLDALRLVEQQAIPSNYKLTQYGRKIIHVGIHSLWDDMIEEYLDASQIAVLSKMAELCQENHSTYTVLRDRQLVEIGNALGADSNSPKSLDIYGVVNELCEQGLAKMGLRRSRGIDAKPTYSGIVRVTRQIDTEWQQIIRALLAEWETTNVDFKQEVNLGTRTGKAEFIKDILGLITTKSSGRRFMVIGFDDSTHDFLKSVDPGITKDRIEDILDAYTEPVPTVQYHTIHWSSGNAGIIEVIRETYKLPYAVKVTMTDKIQAGNVYVRHGSHTVKLRPGDQELNDLIAEGERARQES